MSEECGEECVDGTPCENDADSCPWHGEGDTPDNGRPTKFNDDRAQRAIEAAKLGKSKAGCERSAGVADGTIDNWLDKNPTFEDEDGTEKYFFRAFRRARANGEDEWIDDGRRGENPSFAKFMLSSSYGYSEERDVNVDAEVDATHDVTADFVTFETGQDDNED
jgi:hypothetical protein